MKLPRASRLVAFGLLVALVPAAIVADRALRRAGVAAADRAREERSERAEQAGLAVRAEIAEIEKDAAEGRAREGAESWRMAAPLPGRLSTRPSALRGLSRAELIVRLRSRGDDPDHFRGIPAPSLRSSSPRKRGEGSH